VAIGDSTADPEVAYNLAGMALIPVLSPAQPERGRKSSCSRLSPSLLLGEN